MIEVLKSGSIIFTLVLYKNPKNRISRSKPFGLTYILGIKSFGSIPIQKIQTSHYFFIEIILDITYYFNILDLINHQKTKK